MDRRTFLALLAHAGAVAQLLAACGDDDPSEADRRPAARPDTSVPPRDRRRRRRRSGGRRGERVRRRSLRRLVTGRPRRQPGVLPGQHRHRARDGLGRRGGADARPRSTRVLHVDRPGAPPPLDERPAPPRSTRATRPRTSPRRADGRQRVQLSHRQLALGAGRAHVRAGVPRRARRRVRRRAWRLVDYAPTPRAHASPINALGRPSATERPHPRAARRRRAHRPTRCSRS